MTDKAYTSLLLDYYGAFITARKRELLTMSADEDMSLGEIAQIAGVSRQGVRDAIASGMRQLLHYDSALGLIERDRRLLIAANRLQSIIETEAMADEARRLIDLEIETLRGLIRDTTMEDNNGV